MPDPALRFAAGSPKRPNSGVWRLWTRGSDTYLAVRIAAHVFKLSMHKSGQWISAFTSQSGVVDPATASRRHRTWTRPPEFTPGWVQGPAVVIPLGQVAWPVPAHWAATTTGHGVGPWPGAEAEACLQPPLRRHHRSSRCHQFGVPARGLDRRQPSLSHGETVWVQARQAGISSDERKGLASVEREYDGIEVSGDLSSMDWWGVWITTSPQGPPLLVQFPLGRHHFRVIGDASSQA